MSIDLMFKISLIPTNHDYLRFFFNIMRQMSMIRSYLNCIYYLIAMKNNNIIKILKSLKTYLMNLIYRILHFTKVSQSKKHTVLKSTLMFSTQIVNCVFISYIYYEI